MATLKQSEIWTEDALKTETRHLSRFHFAQSHAGKHVEALWLEATCIRILSSVEGQAFCQLVTIPVPVSRTIPRSKYRPMILTPEIKQQFENDGYIIVPQLFDNAEIKGLSEIVLADQQLASEAYGKRDAAGNETKLALRNDLADSPYSAMVRSQRIAGTMQKLLDAEVYHYHHKMMIKEPRVGGAWEWHQDYGYWYNNGCLYPDMGSCLVSISPATRNNGCLQVIAGSHKMGRIDHIKVGDQVQADPERVAPALERLKLVYCETDAGDAIFFHSNLLHRSDANTSEDPRLSIICCYNTRHNDPFITHGRHPNYSPLEIWPDDQVSQILRKHTAGSENGP